MTMSVLCASFFIRFLWLALTIAGDLLAADADRFAIGMCSQEQPTVFLLFDAANSNPWVINALHCIAEPLPVLVTVWTMGKVSDAPQRPRR